MRGPPGQRPPWPGKHHQTHFPCAVFSFVVTFVVAKVLHATMRLRVSEVEEQVGLDISEHAERAYA